MREIRVFKAPATVINTLPLPKPKPYKEQTMYGLFRRLGEDTYVRVRFETHLPALAKIVWFEAMKADSSLCIRPVYSSKPAITREKRYAMLNGRQFEQSIGQTMGQSIKPKFEIVSLLEYCYAVGYSNRLTILPSRG